MGNLTASRKSNVSAISLRFSCRSKEQIPALTGHSQAIAKLRCSFPEANIGNGAQHFGGADVCWADKVGIVFRLSEILSFAKSRRVISLGSSKYSNVKLQALRLMEA